MARKRRAKRVRGRIVKFPDGRIVRFPKRIVKFPKGRLA